MHPPKSVGARSDSPAAGSSHTLLPLKPPPATVCGDSSEAQQGHSPEGKHGASPGERAWPAASSAAGGGADVHGHSRPTAPADDSPQLKLSIARAQRRPSDLQRCDFTMTCCLDTLRQCTPLGMYGTGPRAGVNRGVLMHLRTCMDPMRAGV